MAPKKSYAKLEAENLKLKETVKAQKVTLNTQKKLISQHEADAEWLNDGMSKLTRGAKLRQAGNLEEAVKIRHVAKKHVEQRPKGQTVEEERRSTAAQSAPILARMTGEAAARAAGPAAHAASARAA